MPKHDDIPPIEVIEAAAKRDREETEELLAGFDRPGRAPRPARRRDFVAHYSGEATGGKAPRTRDEPSRREPTFVLARRRQVPAWLPWVGAATAMLLVGGLVAFLATAESTPPSEVPAAPSATTTIHSAQTLAPRAGEPAPPPAPPSATASAGALAPAAPRPSTRPRPRDPATAGPPAREDFIRDL